MRRSSIAAGVAALAAASLTAVPASAQAVSVAQPAHAATCPAGWYEYYPIPTMPTYEAPTPGGDPEDTVKASYTKIPQTDQVQFVLHSAPEVTWWKQIDIADRNFHAVRDQVDFTRDAKHVTKVLTVTKPEVDACAYLVFWKAKHLGQERAMYQTNVKSSDLGHRIDLTWVKD